MISEKPATIVAYDIIRDGSIGHFILRMNDHIQQGWQPYGALKCGLELQAPYIQVIVRYDTQPIA